MWWRRVLTVPHVIRTVRGGRRGGWDGFWSGVTATGDGGDVLWDTSGTDEVRRYRELLAAHADPALPLVDLGCGNGRFTRALADLASRVVGVDVSPAAVERARAESGGSAVTYQALDITAPSASGALRGELGQDATVFVRGVLHVLEAPERRRVEATVAALAGQRGVVLIAETRHIGSRLGYLERLGAGPRGIPRALGTVLGAGLPMPTAFGEAELDEFFPRSRWERRLVDADAVIMTVPPRDAEPGRALPGFVAVLAARGG